MTSFLWYFDFSLQKNTWTSIMDYFPWVINMSHVLLVLQISSKARTPKRCYFGLKTACINLACLGFPEPSLPLSAALLCLVEKTPMLWQSLLSKEESWAQSLKGRKHPFCNSPYYFVVSHIFMGHWFLVFPDCLVFSHFLLWNIPFMVVIYWSTPLFLLSMHVPVSCWWQGKGIKVMKRQFLPSKSLQFNGQDRLFWD